MPPPLLRLLRARTSSDAVRFPPRCSPWRAIPALARARPQSLRPPTAPQAAEHKGQDEDEVEEAEGAHALRPACAPRAEQKEVREEGRAAAGGGKGAASSSGSNGSGAASAAAAAYDSHCRPGAPLTAQLVRAGTAGCVWQAHYAASSGSSSGIRNGGSACSRALGASPAAAGGAAAGAGHCIAGLHGCARAPAVRTAATALPSSTRPKPQPYGARANAHGEAPMQALHAARHMLPPPPHYEHHASGSSGGAGCSAQCQSYSFEQIAAERAAARASGLVPAVRAAFVNSPSAAQPAALKPARLAAGAQPGAARGSGAPGGMVGGGTGGGVGGSGGAPKEAAAMAGLHIELARLSGLAAARADEHTSRSRSRTQRGHSSGLGAAEYGDQPPGSAGFGHAAAGATLGRRRAHSSGRRSKAEARLYGEDIYSSLSADFLAMFAPSGTVVSTLDAESLT